MISKTSGFFPVIIIITLTIIGCADGGPAEVGMPAPYPAEMLGKDMFKADGVPNDRKAPEFNTEEYKKIDENPFLGVKDNPLSTFSIDVDTASYSNVRRFLNDGTLPYKDAVRIEELVNYFPYDYEEPTTNTPFNFITELSVCPWNPSNKLLMIGMKARNISLENLPPGNIVFLLDVSGSMNNPDKLPLLQRGFSLLVNELRPADTVSIVVYAGAAGMVLPPTKGNEKKKILSALEGLQAGGSTAGGAGIRLAYQTAKNNFIKNGNNRVIIATDGDFNVGASSEGELVRMIEEKREEGIFLTVLGFGTGNYKDSKMEMLADKGNGNYAYIDSLLEAKKVLVTEMGGTLVTIAKDVKLQLEFNPLKVKEYRLIGYENRLLRAEDFDDDKKDAGELGAGHTVTAFYELVMAEGASPETLDRRYTTTEVKPTADGDELLFIKFRYKKPDEDTSVLITKPILYAETAMQNASESFRFASSVVEFGLLLRESEYKGSASWNELIKRAESSKGYDTEGYRNEFIYLADKAKRLSEIK